LARVRANIVAVAPYQKSNNSDRYDPEHGLTIRALAQKGKFPETWCAEIGVTMQTLYNWCHKHEEFDAHCRIAWHLLHHYWTEKAVSLLVHPTAKQTLLLEILRKRFPETWGDDPRNSFEGWKGSVKIMNSSTEEGEEALDVTPDALGKMDRDDIDARIAAIEARRKHDTGA
jgi:hypothetical protein